MPDQSTKAEQKRLARIEAEKAHARMLAGYCREVMERRLTPDDLFAEPKLTRDDIRLILVACGAASSAVDRLATRLSVGGKEEPKEKRLWTPVGVTVNGAR